MSNIVNFEPKTAEEKSLMSAVEQAVTAGNLAMLNSQQRLFYYNQVCSSVGLNPLTRPLDFITLSGKLVLYVKKDGADQLRKINAVSITKLDQQIQDECAIVTASATDKNGKVDSDVGVVSLIGLKGEQRANAIMKAVTKAKRRVTLSISGLGLLDESEIDSIPGAKVEDFNPSVADKTEQKAKAIKEKVSAKAPAELRADAAAPIEPEALPTKPARSRPAKAEPAAEALKAEAPKVEAPLVALPEHELGHQEVPFGVWRGKKLDDLTDREILDIQEFYKNNPNPQTPHFKQFKVNFEAYAALFDLSEFQSEVPEQEEDPGAFFEQPGLPEEPVDQTEANMAHALNAVASAKGEAELRAACEAVIKECKPTGNIALKNLPVERAKKFNADFVAAREKRKAELGIKSAANERIRKREEP